MTNLRLKPKTCHVQQSQQPLVHQFTHEILDIELQLRTWSTDPGFVEMVPDTKEKYDKYWGDYEKMSEFVFFAILLDPQCKSQFLLYTFREMIEYTKKQDITTSSIELKAREMVRETKRKMEGLFTTYLENYDTSYRPNNKFPKSLETELQSYLNEHPIKYNKNFDILSWWKLNGMQYTIVAQMAKDILGIQISTVASKSTFSTGRRSRMPKMDNVNDMLDDDDVTIELAEPIYGNKAIGKMPITKWGRCQ
ncbi:hypothetical protein LXL04_024844 [Taraxacum kok-saghyz]